ncbi:acetyl-CoA acetyltransferase, cytosolic 1-like protein [Tanacetum coccineum]
MDTMGGWEKKDDMVCAFCKSVPEIVDGGHFVLCLVRAELENFPIQVSDAAELWGFHGTEVFDSARVLCVFMVMVDGLDHGQGISWRLSYSWFSCLADVPVGYGWHYGLLWFPSVYGRVSFIMDVWFWLLYTKMVVGCVYPLKDSYDQLFEKFWNLSKDEIWYMGLRNVKGKKKVAYKKGLHTRKETTDEVSDPVKLNECKIASPTIVHYNELYRGIAVGNNELQGSYGEEGYSTSGPASQAALGAGIPNTVVSTTINKVCASGMKDAQPISVNTLYYIQLCRSTMLAAQSIQLGINDVVMAGGMESMSNVPKYIADARLIFSSLVLLMSKGSKSGQDTLVDGMVKDGLWDAFHDFKMGNCGEICVDMRQGLDMDVGKKDLSPDNGWLEIFGDPLLANQRSEIKEICSNADVERPEELNVVVNFQDTRVTWEPPSVMENLAFGGYVYYESKEDSNSVDGKMDSKEENSNILQHVAVSNGLSSDVSPVKIHNEHLVEPELTADRVDSVLTLSIVGYSDLQVNEPIDGNGSTGKLDSELDVVPANEKIKLNYKRTGDYLW